MRFALSMLAISSSFLDEIFLGAMNMKLLQKGFTLIELMIVVAIIGILAAVAIPAYQDYTARAQVTEAVELLSGGKTPMAEYYADKGAWPAAAVSVMGNLRGKYTSIIAIATATGGTLTLLATMKATGVNASVQGGTISLSTTDGGKVWDCTAAQPGGGGNILPKFRPAACR